MQTIGDRLEEARKHKGISVREAAEATKIRGEYLAAFEGNSFDIDLPEIYIRGFLRNYANFLKLNGTRILTDYDALGSGEAAYSGPAEKGEGRSESYGRMDLGEGQPAAADVSRPAPREGEEAHERRRESAFVGDEGPDRTFYYKVGGIVAASLIAVVALGYVVVSVIGSDAQETSEPAGEIEDGTQEFFLVGRGDIDNIEVTEVETDEILFEGSLSEGDRIALRRRGPVDIVVSQRENLRLEEGGRGGNFPGSGRGQTRWQGLGQ